MRSTANGIDLPFSLDEKPGSSSPKKKHLIRPPKRLETNLFSSITDSFHTSAVISTQETHIQQDAPSLEELVPSGQPQLPPLQRIAKALHEESFPWVLAFSAPSVLSLLLQNSSPLLMSFGGELAFLAFCSFKLLHQFGKPTAPINPRLSSRSWENLYQNVWNSHPDKESRRAFFMGWFYDAPFEDLCREDALTFLAWMKYSLPIEHLTKEQQLRLEFFDLPELERQANDGIRLPTRNSMQLEEDQTKNKQLTHPIRFNLEPLRYRHKPLVFYGVTHGAFYWLRYKLEKEYGFEYHKAKDSTKDLSYWYRAPTSKTNNNSPPTPLVFVHGVGGLPFYFQLVADIVQRIESSGDDTPLLLLDLPFVSLRMYNDIPAITSQIECVCSILDSVTNGEKVKATFVGHSFGSIILSWMVQTHPDRVASCVFMDPICFQLHMQRLLFNFHMKRVDERHQKSLNDWVAPFSLGAITNLAGSEMHTNNAMLRQFWWASNALWPSDLEKGKIPATVLLSANDAIVPTKEVAELISTFNHDSPPQEEEQQQSWDEFFADLTLEKATKDNFFIKAFVLQDAVHGAMVLDEANRHRLVDVVDTMMGLNARKTN